MSDRNGQDGLSDDEVRTVREILADYRDSSFTRRAALVGGGALLAGSSFGAGQATAQPDASPSVIGQQNDPSDLWGDDVDINSLTGSYPTNVRGISDSGVVASIDPSTTSTPIADAITAGADVVLLPSGTVSESGPITNATRVAILGQGLRNTKVEESSGSNDLFQFDGDDHVFLDAFELDGVDKSTRSGGFPLHFINNPSRQINIGRIRFRQWQSILVYFDTAHPWSSHWGQLEGNFLSYDDQMLFIDDAGPGLTIDNLICGSTSGNEIRILNVNGSINIGSMNVGGSPGAGIKTSAGPNFRLNVDHINFEPTSGTQTEVVEQENEGHTRFGSIRNHADVNQIYNLSFSPANIRMGTVRSNGTVANNTVVVNDDTAGECYFWGPSGDVTNSSGGTLSNPVVALGDLTTVT